MPPSGEGVYYFSTYLLIQCGEIGSFNMMHNDGIICSPFGDHNTNGDGDSMSASCSGVVSVAAGNAWFIPLLYMIFTS